MSPRIGIEDHRSYAVEHKLKPKALAHLALEFLLLVGIFDVGGSSLKCFAPIDGRRPPSPYLLERRINAET